MLRRGDMEKDSYWRNVGQMWLWWVGGHVEYVVWGNGWTGGLYMRGSIIMGSGSLGGGMRRSCGGDTSVEAIRIAAQLMARVETRILHLFLSVPGLALDLRGY